MTEIEAATVTGIREMAEGKAVGAAELNDAYRDFPVGLFEMIEQKKKKVVNRLVPSGNQLIIRVVGIDNQHSSTSKQPPARTKSLPR